MTTKATVERRIAYPPTECAEHSPEYPCSDGEPMAEHPLQFTAITDTVVTLKARYAGRDDVYVGGDMFVYYRRGDGSQRVAPDVFVVFGANRDRPRHSWLIWEEGGLVPSFVLEVGGASTWRRDAGEKREIYARMGVLEYWRFDPNGDLFSPILIGERLLAGRYRPLEVVTDDDGILRGHSAALGLDLCVPSDGRLRLFDSTTGEWLLNPDEKDVAWRAQAIALREKDEEILRLRRMIEELQGQQR